MEASFWNSLRPDCFQYEQRHLERFCLLRLPTSIKRLVPYRNAASGFARVEQPPRIFEEMASSGELAVQSVCARRRCIDLRCRFRPCRLLLLPEELLNDIVGRVVHALAPCYRPLNDKFRLAWPVLSTCKRLQRIAVPFLVPYGRLDFEYPEDLKLASSTMTINEWLHRSFFNPGQYVDTLSISISNDAKLLSTPLPLLFQWIGGLFRHLTALRAIRLDVQTSRPTEGLSILPHQLAACSCIARLGPAHLFEHLCVEAPDLQPLYSTQIINLLDQFPALMSLSLDIKTGHLAIEGMEAPLCSKSIAVLSLGFAQIARDDLARFMAWFPDISFLTVYGGLDLSASSLPKLRGLTLELKSPDGLVDDFQVSLQYLGRLDHLEQLHLRSSECLQTDDLDFILSAIPPLKTIEFLPSYSHSEPLAGLQSVIQKLQDLSWQPPGAIVWRLYDEEPTSTEEWKRLRDACAARGVQLQAVQF
jgi:hypothetical protein